MYVSPNFKTKKELKEAIANNVKVQVFQSGIFPCKQNGEVSVEGPHYPQPHKWYARVLIEKGIVLKVLG